MRKELEALGFFVVDAYTRKVECVVVGHIGVDQGYVRGIKTRSMQRAEQYGTPIIYVPAELFGRESRPAA